jgi:hypothetical protein
VEKASSLIEAEDDLGASDEVSISTGNQSRSTAERASGVERTRSGFARLDGDLEEGVNEPAASRDSTTGAHPRAPKPIESGVFSGGSSQAPGGHIALSLQNALSSASRGEAELAALHRSMRDASRALTASRHAHESLTEELRMMHRGLSEVMSEKAAMERYAALLTQERDAALDAAEETRREAKRDREFLLREQDRFIQLLLEEHEAEVQQLRRALGLRTTTQASAASLALHVSAVQPNGAPLEQAAARSSESSVASADVSVEDVAPHTSPGIAPPANPPPQTAPARAAGRDEDDEPTSPRGLSMGARLQLAHGSGERHRAIPLPGPAERGAFDKSPLETQRSESPPLPTKSQAAKSEVEERPSTYPPPPAVLDLDSLAHEIDGNSERPPPIRRISVNEPKLHLRPARVPTQLLDTLVSKTRDEPNRKG